MKTLLLLLQLTAATLLQAQVAELWITDTQGQDTITVQIGSEREFNIYLNTFATRISGFQCFLDFPDGVIEPVPYSALPNGWLQNLNIFPGTVIFADDHDSRLDPLPNNQLDWCYQTQVSQNGVRPTYVANGAACKFRLRFLQPIDNYVTRFSHDNGTFRNTIYWAGTSADEHRFSVERPLVITVIGLSFGPLPDRYLTSASPVDSLNLYEYLPEIEGYPDSSYTFRWQHIGGAAVCTIDTLRRADGFWMYYTDNGDDLRSVDLRITASSNSLSAIDTMTVFKGEPPLLADTLVASDPFLEFYEDECDNLTLDDYVEDLDDPDEDLVWELMNPETIVSMEIDQDRVATFCGPEDWWGRDTLCLVVRDPGGMADTACVVVNVLPVNDDPRLMFPDTMRIHPNEIYTLALDSLTHDPDHADSELSWMCASDTSLIALRLFPEDYRLELEVQEGTPLWSEAEFIITAADPTPAFGVDTMLVIVTSYPPVWTHMADVILDNGATQTRSLNEYVEDLDDADELLTFSYYGNQRTSISLDPVSHVAQFSAPQGWQGVERVLFQVTDPGGEFDVDTIAVASLLGADPVAGLVPDLIMLPAETNSSIWLNECVWDLDSPASSMVWEVAHQSLFTVNILANTNVSVQAPAIMGSVDRPEWTVTDPDGHTATTSSIMAVIDTTGVPVVFPFDEIWMTTSSIDSSIALDEFVIDYDHTPEQISWSVDPGSLVTPSVRAADRVLVIQSGSVDGSETLLLTATDPDGNSRNGSVLVHVSEGHAPIVSEFPPRYIIAGQTRTIYEMENYVYDPDLNEVIEWSFIDPVNSPVTAMYYAAGDSTVIQTDASYTGVDQLTAVATDRDNMYDSAAMTITSLENVAPVLQTGVLANTAEPGIVDLLVVSNESLRSLEAYRVRDNAPLSFHRLSVLDDTVELRRADYNTRDGGDTIVVVATDLPAFTMVSGNSTTDSIMFSSGSLNSFGDGLLSPDGLLRISSLQDEESRWLIQQRRDRGIPEQLAGWTVLSLAGEPGCRVEIPADAGELQVWDGYSWTSIAMSAPESGRRVGELEPGQIALRLIEGENPLLPTGLVLHQAYPNPFNPSTWLSYELPERGDTQLVIHDLLGRQVRVLHAGEQVAGSHRLCWDGRNEAGVVVASGVYFAHLNHPTGSSTVKLILMR